MTYRHGSAATTEAGLSLAHFAMLVVLLETFVVGLPSTVGTLLMVTW